MLDGELKGTIAKGICANLQSDIQITSTLKAIKLSMATGQALIEFCGGFFAGMYIAMAGDNRGRLQYHCRPNHHSHNCNGASTMNSREFHRMQEQIQQLVGERGDSSREAVIRGDIPLVMLKSQPVTEVTPQAYNQLLADMRQIAMVLNALKRGEH